MRASSIERNGLVCPWQTNGSVLRRIEGCQLTLLNCRRKTLIDMPSIVHLPLIGSLRMAATTVGDISDGVTSTLESEEHRIATSVTVVIPAYNERATICGVVLSARRYADRVLVIDDGSEDGTGDLAQLSGASVIRIPRNSGKGNALAIGLNTAALEGAEIVVCLDADGQHEPADIPKLIKPIRDCRADMVIGSRFLRRESRIRIPSYRKIGQGVLTLATNLGSSVKVTDSQSGYRAFRSEVIRGFSFSETGMGIESEVVRNAVRLGLRIEEVPILAKYGGGETSTYSPGRHGMKVLRSVLRTVRSEHPLLYFGMAGLGLILLGIGFGVLSLTQYLNSGYLPVGPSLAAAFAAGLGALFVVVGLILSAIRDTVSDRGG